MKKLFFAIIISFSFTRVSASLMYSYNYTEWSDTHPPSNIHEFIIETETRYKWIQDEVETTEYYTSLDNATKVEGTEKIFYRYILSDNVYIGEEGQIVKYQYYCLNHRCVQTNISEYRNYVSEEPSPPVEEPNEPTEPNEEEETPEEPEQEVDEEEIEFDNNLIDPPKTIDNICYYLIISFILFITLLFLINLNKRII